MVFWHWDLRRPHLKELDLISRDLCLHFAMQDGQDLKNQKENHATKVTKIPKTKTQKYGMNKTLTMRKSNGISALGSSSSSSKGTGNTVARKIIFANCVII